MDRRSWLWRRKSSEKSPGETDSSGSISSRSERFPDDQIYPIHNPQSPEVTSKAVLADEDLSDNVRTLTEKLSAALLNISAKEELVQQHVKVAEEAVSGWEKAEDELSALKQQLDAATKKNSELEDRVGHLDAALKECVRQLRQSREERDERISEAVTKKISEWESTKSELEAQLVELQAQLQTARDEATSSADSDLWKRFDAVEKENMSLKRELLSRAEEIEIRILERDLSTQAAETASKLHLESIKKVAKLEAECRKLKAMARKASAANEYKSLTTSSIGGESITDSQSDNWERLLAVESHSCKMSDLEMKERDPSWSDSWACAHVTELDQYKNRKPIGRNHTVPSVEINLMDDFLEMERLAAFPDTLSGSSYLEAEPVSDKGNNSGNPWKEELESMISRTGDLEEKLDMMEEEKNKSEMALNECQRQLETLSSQLQEADTKIGELQAQLALVNESKQAREEEIKDIEAKSEVTKSQLRIAEAEIKTLLSKVVSLDSEVEKERALSAENAAKSQKLEDELSQMKCEAELQHEKECRRVASFNEEEKELAVAASKLADCQKTISSLGLQLKSLASFEDLLFDSEKSSDASSEGLKDHADGEQQRPDPRNQSSGRDSEAFQVSKGALRSKKGSNRESPLPLNSSFVSEKNRNGFGKFPPRGHTKFRNEN
ncbi:hypothetical protein SADUNF_Sadunf07G0085900 [Salix dunnii]|uniref:Filament-like plant protein n=1 Tax=Salix dunnii TaxID=1413687 RepID=A0A835K075_9ROSI|nr:hypothetical protein SADUNF_Sadunf07G0085900 [Salix dunnii]